MFRLSLLGATLTMVSVAAALGLVYYSMIEAELRRVEQSNIDEIAELQNLYDEGGISRVRAAKAAGIVPQNLSSNTSEFKQLYDRGGITAVERAVTVRGASYEALYFLQARRQSQVLIRGNILGQGDLLASEAIAQDDLNNNCLLYTSDAADE